MKRKTNNSKIENKEKELPNFIKDVKLGKYTKNKINNNLRVSAYTTNSVTPTYTFGVR